MSEVQDPTGRRPEDPAGARPFPDDDAAAAAADAAAAAIGAEEEASIEVDEAGVDLELDLELAQVAKERDDYLDALRRVQADFENYKKRIVRQQTEHLERAASQLVEKLLPVFDTSDLALAH